MSAGFGRNTERGSGCLVSVMATIICGSSAEAFVRSQGLEGKGKNATAAGQAVKQERHHRRVSGQSRQRKAGAARKNRR